MTTPQGESAIQSARTWLEQNSEVGPRLSDEIWRLAEPGLCEFESARVLCAELEQAGFEIEMGVSGMPTAFIARYGTEGPSIGLMCEYDATPGDSQQPVPYREPVKPLAAGFTDLHNGIGAASVAAALAIKHALVEQGLPGSVVVFGTPAEKLCLSKPFMARDGHFDGLDAVVAWHPRPYSTTEWDTGPGCYQAEVHEFHGTSTYASRPWTGVSALDALTLMNVIVQFLREHIPPQHRTSINELVSHGGQHPTALPNYAEAWYVHRSLDIAGIQNAQEVLARAARSAAEAIGAGHARRLVAATRPWLPNHTMAQAAFRGMARAGAPEFPEDMREFAAKVLDELGREPMDEPFATELERPESGITSEFSGGADDVTEFCWHAPTARIYIAYGINIPGLPNWAQSAFASTSVAHATVRTAAESIAYTTLDLLTDAELRREAMTEFERRREEAGAVPPLLPPDAVPPVELADSPPYVRDHALASIRH